MGWDWEVTELSPAVRRYRPTAAGALCTWAEVFESWRQGSSFALSFVSQLQDAPFDVYRWETPGIVRDQLDTGFEFVLVDAPEIDVGANMTAFEDYFSSSQHTVSFMNLGRDALLIVPCPIMPQARYSHLSQFMRSADMPKILDLWRTVGEKMMQRVSQVPVWLSTAGGGVPWLHVRLDAQPKYYHHQPYRHMP